MRNLRLKTFAFLISTITILAAASVYAYYQTVPALLQVYLRDPPAYSGDVQHVYLTFYKIEVHRIEGDAWYQVGGSFFQTIDLKAAINFSLLLASQQIPQGTYNIVRITLSSARVVLLQSNVTTTTLLSIPSDLHSGLKIQLQGILTSKAGATGGILVDMTVSDADLHLGVLTPAINARVTS